jgi:hypothetical protein
MQQPDSRAPLLQAIFSFVAVLGTSPSSSAIRRQRGSLLPSCPLSETPCPSDDRHRSAGTILAPLYSGFILQAKGWRWIQWVQLIVNGAMCLIEFGSSLSPLGSTPMTSADDLLLAFLRETRGAIILAKRARKMRKSTGDGRFRAPIELERDSYSQKLREDVAGTFKLLYKEPVVTFFSLWISFAWGVMFLVRLFTCRPSSSRRFADDLPPPPTLFHQFFTVIPLTFGGNHGWSTGVAGLGYSGLVIGTCLGFASNFVQVGPYA